MYIYIYKIVPIELALKPNPPSSLEVTTQRGNISLDTNCTTAFIPYIKDVTRTDLLDDDNDV
jgi:hypothetical protein